MPPGLSFHEQTVFFPRNDRPYGLKRNAFQTEIAIGTICRVVFLPCRHKPDPFRRILPAHRQRPEAARLPCAALPSFRPYLTAGVPGLYVPVACQAAFSPSPADCDGMPDAYRFFREKPYGLFPVATTEEVSP